MPDVSSHRQTVSAGAIAKRLYATLIGLVALLAVAVFLIAVTARAAAIASLPQRILAGVADVVFGTALLVGAIYVTVRMFVRLLGARDNS